MSAIWPVLNGNQNERITHIPKHNTLTPLPPESAHGVDEKELIIRSILNTVPSPRIMGHDEVISYGGFSTEGNFWYWDTLELRKSSLPLLKKCAKTLGLK